MKTLVELARDLCWLRRGPQDLPYSPLLGMLLFGAAVILDLVLVGVLRPDQVRFPRTLLDDVLMVGLPCLALTIAGKGERIWQTVGAISLVSIVFALLFAPILLVPTVAVGATPTGIQLMAGWLWLALLSWHLMVTGHILRHALEVPMTIGVMLALGFFVANVMIDIALFPATP